jgi:hypothetical protein
VFDLKYHFRQDARGGHASADVHEQWLLCAGGKLAHYGNPGDIGTSGLMTAYRASLTRPAVTNGAGADT